ncbi:MAG TPA: 1,2-phenylacetyl-CoA epoxidase subunit PaaD [Hyphomicrobiaceae bacterium]|jgi:ring-1,2-phenylacetyl-CoA epoxidase subunit PaaD|nr:1,2-phenylacetyl-CoA epoxidase subunit PaaD [Hyphomicrobiaceae bacterium]
MSRATAINREALRRRAFEAAAAVCDPEVPVLTIADLGVLHDVSVDEAGQVVVTLLPTYTGCPAMSVIQRGVEAALSQAGFTNFAVKLSHSPAWSTALISEAAREKLCAAGIAPPGRGGRKSALFAVDDVVACPRCGSHATEKISEFGATACKALWRCTSCREPFEYFKCI